MLSYLTTAIDYLGLYWRARRRARTWAGAYRPYLDGKADRPPFPSVVQLLTTERCNLRCKMCNQWGDNGYFLAGKRDPSSMPIDGVLSFLDSFAKLNPDYLLSLHGGEPLLYRETPELFRYIAEHRIDTMISTNGTMLGVHAKSLARANRHLVYLLSIDGGEETNDRIRGAGVLKKITEGLVELRRECLAQRTGRPKLVINYCVNEHNPDDIEAIVEVARELGALFVNYNLRWFLPQEKGEAYDRILQEEFGVRPSGAWSGWVTSDTFEGIDGALDRVYRKKRFQAILPLPPFATILPRALTQDQAKAFYHQHDALFGIEKCIMPSYWARIHSNGDLIYCPGHPDIVPGNVFRDDFETIYLNKLSQQLRRRVEKKLLPICNRCCGLYMTDLATAHLGKGWVPQPSPHPPRSGV